MSSGHASAGAVAGAAGIGVTAVLLAVSQGPSDLVPAEGWHLLIGAFGLPGVLASLLVILVAWKQLRAPQRREAEAAELARSLGLEMNRALTEHREQMKDDLEDALTKAYLTRDLKHKEEQLEEARRLLRDSA